MRALATMDEESARESIKAAGFDRPLTRDDFTKVQLLGRGDVGKVYLVRHNLTGRFYAWKQLNKREMVARNKVKRALTEREILSTVQHPFITTLYYSFQTKNHLILVTEYCAGGEFFRVLQRQPNKCLPEDAARFYAAEIVLALEYLHICGFIYRDLKPENLLLHASGHIMLADFDLSKAAAVPLNPKVVRNMIDSSSRFVTNSFVGTEEYLAPEVIDGYGHTTTVDWWTLGILLYEMLYGTTPFRGRSRESTFDYIRSKGMRWPDTPVVTKEGRSLIKRLLEKDPRKRLGAEHGAADIKEHPWFKTKINWALIRNAKPPIVPDVRFEGDTRYFRYQKDDQMADKDGAMSIEEIGRDENFREWTPIIAERHEPQNKEKKEKKLKKEKKGKKGKKEKRGKKRSSEGESETSESSGSSDDEDDVKDEESGSTSGSTSESDSDTSDGEERKREKRKKKKKHKNGKKK